MPKVRVQPVRNNVHLKASALHRRVVGKTRIAGHKPCVLGRVGVCVCVVWWGRVTQALTLDIIRQVVGKRVLVNTASQAVCLGSEQVVGGSGQVTH